MKIPQNLIASLLAESSTFRSYAAGLLNQTDIAETRATVKLIVNRADGKIAAIKGIREFADQNRSDMKAAFPEIPWSISYDGKSQVIGLADSKRFVESIRNFD